MKRGREEVEFDKNDIHRFFYVCEEGDMAKVQDFIKRGIDVDCRNEDKETGLHNAAFYGWVDVVKVLIQNGADVNAVDKNKWTPLHCAAQEGFVDVAKLLIQNGADVNAVNMDKETQLLIAAINGHVDVAKLLIQNGADVNAVDVDNYNPLHCVAENGHVDIAKMLIQNGADVNAADSRKWTALHWIAVSGHIDVAKVLIQNGADVNAVNKENMTPLHLAVCHNGHVDVAKVLIQNGADVNAAVNEDNDNETALHYAVAKGHVVHTLQLLCFGATIDEMVLYHDLTGLLGQINNRMKLLQAGKRIGTSLMSKEERRFMWNLAFSLTIQHPAAAFKAYYTIRSFITFHGIFMVPRLSSERPGV